MKFETIDEYHSAFPNVAERLDTLRRIIMKIAPGATSGISYGMPGFKYFGALIYYGAWTSHIGLYAMPSAIKHFAAQLDGFETSKGAIRFPNDKPLPVALIEKIVKFRVQENMIKADNISLAGSRKK